MSEYLGIKKNGVMLTYFCRSHPIYAHCTATFKWSKITESDIVKTIENLSQDIKDYERQINSFNMVLDHLTNYDDIANCIQNIEELQGEIQSLEHSSTIMFFIDDIRETQNLESDGGETEATLEWCKGL